MEDRAIAVPLRWRGVLVTKAAASASSTCTSDVDVALRDVGQRERGLNRPRRWKRRAVAGVAAAGAAGSHVVVSDSVEIVTIITVIIIVIMMVIVAAVVAAAAAVVVVVVVVVVSFIDGIVAGGKSQLETWHTVLVWRIQAAGV